MEQPGDEHSLIRRGSAPVENGAIGPYMLVDFVEDLPLQIPEREDVEITCVEAWEENLYIGTSAHEIFHFVLLPPSVPGTPQPANSSPFPSQKPSFILASRIQPPLTASAVSQSPQPHIKRILLLPGPSKLLVLSSTGLLSFWSYPELSPAYGGSPKVGSTSFVGALDQNELDREEEEAATQSGYSQTGSIGRISGTLATDSSKLVMIMGKKDVRMVRVKEEGLRAVKHIECPSLIYAARRGPIACVATSTDYSLLHLEMGGIFPLFPILSNPPPLTPQQETPPQIPKDSPSDLRTARTPSPAKQLPSPKLPSASEDSGNDSRSAKEKPSLGRRASSSAAGRSPLARSSSLQPRSRSEVLSSTPPKLGPPEELAGNKHTRASSTGGIRGDKSRSGGSIGRNSPLSRESSIGHAAGKEVTQGLASSSPETQPATLAATAKEVSRAKSPTARTPIKPAQLPSQPSNQRPATGSRSTTPNPTPPGSATSSYPKPRPSKPPSAKPPQQTRQFLKPHIVTPTPNEFLLMTGTSSLDPGVGMFVNNDGDPTRGTISLSKYPEEVVLDNDCLIALLPCSEDDRVRVLEVIPLLESHTNDGPNANLIHATGLSLTANAGIAKVLGLQEIVSGEIGSRLKFDRVRSVVSERNTGTETTLELQDWETRRNAEELEAANRISKLGGKVVVFSGRSIWRLIPSPLVIRLDSRLPLALYAPNENTPEVRKERDRRRMTILSILKEVHGLEPTTERMFHEIAYIKQKCGVILLLDFLSLPREEDKRQFPTELLATEKALIEGGLDPRIVVSLFPGFEGELREGRNGVWVYGGVREVVDIYLSERKSQIQTQSTDDNGDTEWKGRRDLLLLLRRYLSAWRQKKGFGSVSQADEKEVFWTIDAALIRCLLTLEATRSPSALKHMAGEVDVRAELYRMVDYPPSIECFDRCVYLLEKFKRLYVLSILYQSKKMSREVLETWRRLFESGDEKMMAEFGKGEEKIAEYLLGKKDRELVKDYGLWLARRNHRLGVQVFTDPRARVKWSVEEVLNMLREHAPESLKGFVEYLVVEKKDYAHSHELLMIYLGSLTSTLSSESPATAALKSSYEAYRVLNLPKPTYRKFLEENTLPSTSHGDDTDWWNQRLMFLDLLASASEIGAAFDNTMMMERLEPFKGLLVAEMIVLYGKGGSHDKALQLLVHELRDFDGSIEYCLNIGKTTSSIISAIATDKSKKRDKDADRRRREEQERLFGLLLVEALKLDEWVVRQEWVELLLDRWGTWLDVAHVLSVIPDTYSIALISKFLIGALRNLMKEKNETIIARAVRRGENLRVNAEFVDKCDELGPTIQAFEGPASS
ncbi:hypothetical protein BDZ91DRAFT_787678 [Kalaharituber pfeilii]|nr:hypothetical protein BDZ91DRAFT_787678 [Kalaharituber pfeilii]